jgi:hypothetical protein
MQTLDEIKIDIVNGKKPYYVYLLFKPDGTPFYVGKGKSKRISAHEAETRYFLNGRTWKGLNTFKVNTIAKIWSTNDIVRYQIDSWHDDGISSGNREIELVEQCGRRILNTGPLTNIRDGGDLMTEEYRRILGEKIRQYYIDHPEAREAMSERMIQYHIDNPYTDEQRDHLSDVLKNYCIEHPEFVDNLISSKNDWIINKPEEYLATEQRRIAICQTQDHREKISNIMRNYFSNNPDELERIKRQGANFWINNPEAIELARQNSIRNNTGQKLVDWYASDDPEVILARKEKAELHSEWLSGWHETEEGKLKTREAAKKRNEKIRTEEHRKKMSSRTAEYIKNNPEADKARREKALATRMPKIQERQKKLLSVQEELFAAGKIKKKYEYIKGEVLYVWKKKGFVSKDFTV